MRARRAPRLAAASAGASAGSSSARPALARWAVVQLQGLKAGPATAAERQRYLELLADLTTASAEAQAAAGREGIVVVLASLTAHRYRRGVQLHGLRALCHLLATHKDATFSAGPLVAALQGPSESARYWACRALTALCHAEVGAHSAFRAGCVPALTDVVDAATDAGLKAVGVCALVQLLDGRDQPGVHAEALAAGCAALAVRALPPPADGGAAGWAADEARLGEACLTLLALLALAGGCRCCGARPEEDAARLALASTRVRDAGGLRAAVRALGREGAPRGVLTAAARVLMALAAADDASALAVCRAGGARALVGAMRAHGRLVELQSLGCGALGDLAWRFPTLVREVGGVGAALGVLDALPQERDVARRACAVLANLAEAPERKLELCDAGAAAALARTVRRHLRGEAGVLQAALRTLAALAAGCSRCEHAICDADGAAACVAALRQHPRDQGVQEWGLGTLINLAAGQSAGACLRAGAAAAASGALACAALQTGARQAALRALALMTPAAHALSSEAADAAAAAAAAGGGAAGAAPPALPLPADWVGAWAAAAARVAAADGEASETRGEALALLAALAGCGAAAQRAVLGAGGADAAAAAMLAQPGGLAGLAPVRNGHALLHRLATGAAGGEAVRAACARRLLGARGARAPPRRLRSHEACAVCLGTNDGAAAHMLTLGCGHTFCAACTMQHVRTRLLGSGCRCASCARAALPECPLCRQELTPAAIVGCFVWGA